VKFITKDFRPEQEHLINPSQSDYEAEMLIRLAQWQIRQSTLEWQTKNDSTS
jgi:hypothetical protein